MIDEAKIREKMHGHGLIRSIDRLSTGPVRLETELLYPDGSSVDVFVVEEGSLIADLKLSDLGQTMSWLLDLQVRPWLSRKRQAFLEDALRLHRVKQVGGALELPLASLDDLVSAVVALSDRQTMKDLLLAA